MISGGARICSSQYYQVRVDGERGGDHWDCGNA